MELHIYLAFLTATTIMIALPGPSVFLTVAHSISFGWKPALSTVAGETAGIAVQLMVAVIGLTSLLNLAAEAFEALRWAGALYLIYLGVRQWLGAKEPPVFDHAPVSKTNLFVQGLVVTIPNPKSLIFIAAFLPQFIDTSRPIELQFVLIIPTFLIITFVVTSLWAILAGNVRGFLLSRRVFQSVLRSAGGLMIAAGVGLALTRRAD